MTTSVASADQQAQRRATVITAGIALLVVVGHMLFPGCSSKPARSGEGQGEWKFRGSTMGTQYHLTVARPPADQVADDVQAEIDQLLEKINQQMSTYIKTSELSRFNISRSTDWFPVSKQLATVVAAGQQISEQSNGAFDITVGPLVNLWNFGPDRKSIVLPKDEAITKALSASGYSYLQVRLDPPALKKAKPELFVDLSAIAKGHAVDAVAALLDARGIEHYLVEIGGEVRTRGRNPDQVAWKVGIESPAENGRQLARVVSLSGWSMATSGDYRNYHEIDGKRFSHTIDPKTGRPVTHSLAMTSVLHNDCMMADAYATAIMVLGPKEGMVFAEKHKLAVLTMTRQEGSGYRRQTSSRFDAMYGKSPGKQP